MPNLAIPNVMLLLMSVITVYLVSILFKHKWMVWSQSILGRFLALRTQAHKPRKPIDAVTPQLIIKKSFNLFNSAFITGFIWTSLSLWQQAFISWSQESRVTQLRRTKGKQICRDSTSGLCVVFILPEVSACPVIGFFFFLWYASMCCSFHSHYDGWGCGAALLSSCTFLLSDRCALFHAFFWHFIQPLFCQPLFAQSHKYFSVKAVNGQKIDVILSQ